HDLQPFPLVFIEPEDLTDNGSLLGRQGHLAQAGGGDPFLAQPDLGGDLAPLDASLHLGGDDLLGDFQATHARLLVTCCGWMDDGGTACAAGSPRLPTTTSAGAARLAPSDVAGDARSAAA